jgi:hypothetical protein
MPVFLTQLEVLLAAERQHLLAGSIREACALNPEKRSLLEAIEATLPAAAGQEAPPLDSARLLAVKHAASENAAMLSACLHGLRSALARLDRCLHDVSVGAYDATGSLMPFPAASGSYLRKF